MNYHLDIPTYGNKIVLKEFEKPIADGWWGYVNCYNDIEVVLVLKEFEDEDYCVRHEDEYGNPQNDELEDFIKEFSIKTWIGYIPMVFNKEEKDV